MAEADQPIAPESETSPCDTAPRESRFRRFKSWCRRIGRAVVPGPRAWKGAAWGLLAATVILWVAFTYGFIAAPSPNYAGLRLAPVE